MGNLSQNSKSNRDSRVELARIYACLSVLVLHFKPGTFVNGQRSLSRVFITCICTDAVGIFLLITGFFFFAQADYGKKIQSCIRKIALPTIVYTLLIAFLYPVLIGGSVDYGEMVRQFIVSIITCNPQIHNAQHLWYMYLYCIIVVAFPVLNFIINKISSQKHMQSIFVVMTFILLFINDCCGNNLLHCEMVPLTVFIPGCLFVLCGSIIYNNRHYIEGKILPFIAGVTMFCAVNIARTVYMRALLNTDASLTHLYGWYTSAGFICAISLLVSVLSIKPFYHKAINTISATTMDIYILHVIVSELITMVGYKNWVITTFLDGSESFIQFAKFTAIYSISVFAICCVLSITFKKIKSISSK